MRALMRVSVVLVAERKDSRPRGFQVVGGADSDADLVRVVLEAAVVVAEDQLVAVAWLPLVDDRAAAASDVLDAEAMGGHVVAEPYGFQQTTPQLSFRKGPLPVTTEPM